LLSFVFSIGRTKYLILSGTCEALETIWKGLESTTWFPMTNRSKKLWSNCRELVILSSSLINVSLFSFNPLKVNLLLDILMICTSPFWNPLCKVLFVVTSNSWT
jgi:hypothetical protein